MPRILPDGYDVLVLPLTEGTSTHPNAGTAGSSGDWIEYGTPLNNAIGLLKINNNRNAIYTPSSYLVNLRCGAGGGNDVVVSPNISLSGWVFLRRYTNYFAELFNKQYFLNGWSNPFLTFGFQLVNTNDGQLDLYITLGGTLQFIRTPSNFTVPVGSWSHIGGTWDGTTLKLYINGSLAVSNTFSGVIDFNTSGRGQWYCGGIPGSSTNQDPPAIFQDIRVANITRPQSYFANIYYNGFLP